MTECGGIRERLDAFSTGEIGLRERASIEAHLEACAGCRLEYNRLRSLAALLRGAPVPPVPEGFASRLARRHAAAAASISPFSGWRAAPVPLRVAAAAVAAAGLLAGAIMGWNFGGSREDVLARADVIRMYYADFLGHAPEASMVQAYGRLAEIGGEGRSRR